MRGINHGHFASGSMPSNVLQHDLPVDDDITFESAHETIANHVTSFIIVTTGLPKEDYLTAVASMKVAFYDTKDTIQVREAWLYLPGYYTVPLPLVN